MSTTQQLKQSIIIAFSLWHAAGIAAYALPDSLKEYQPIGWFHRQISNVTNDYVQMTSQWQKWPLFAPDPLRRVVAFTIEAQFDSTWPAGRSPAPGGSALVQGEGWHAVKRISPETTHWWDVSSELKTIRRLDEQESYAPIRKRYIEEQCSKLDPGTPIRLHIDFFIIPKHEEPQTIAQWRAWEPEWQTKIDVETVCPVSTSRLPS